MIPITHHLVLVCPDVSESHCSEASEVVIVYYEH
jgi:hypothetical protein